EEWSPIYSNHIQSFNYYHGSSGYKLIGVIVHSGPKDCGYYTFYLLRNNQWSLYDNGKVTAVSTEQVPREKAYVYLYEQQ
ncbi:hypothetical protein, partial [Arachidicoccus sp.]|uniref:hypothetical protein n=1 Tax=Arachidicoccus sp. TaxID=1872624 RepID=UPI003D1F4B58